MMNEAQTKKLADFFFDVAKGLIVGGFGLATVVPAGLKLFYSILSIIFAFLCLKAALKLLET